MNHGAQFEARIEQLVYEPLHNRELVVRRASVPTGAADLEVRYSLSRHIAANREAGLAFAGNIYYAIHEPDYQDEQQTAVLIFRQSIVAGTRNTTKAHVLIGPAAVMTPDSAVAMLDAWPWQLDDLAETAPMQVLEPIGLEEYRHAVDGVRSVATRQPPAGRDMPDQQQIDRLLIALAQYGSFGLSAKVSPVRRAALVRAILKRLGPGALSWGFSMHEKQYKSPDLPALVFFTEEIGATVLSTRMTIDLDEVWLDQSSLLGGAALKIAEAYRNGDGDAVRGVLEAGFPGPRNLSLADCLKDWARTGEVVALDAPYAAVRERAFIPPRDQKSEPAPAPTPNAATVPPASPSSDEPGSEHPAGSATEPGGADLNEQRIPSENAVGDARPDPDSDSDSDPSVDPDADLEPVPDRGEPDQPTSLGIPDNGNAAEPSRAAEDFVAGAQASELGLQTAQALWNEYRNHYRRLSSFDKSAGPPAWLLDANQIPKDYLVMGWHMIDSRVRQLPRIADDADSPLIQDLIEFVALSVSRPVATVVSVTPDKAVEEIGLPPAVRRQDSEPQLDETAASPSFGSADVDSGSGAVPSNAVGSGDKARKPVVDRYSDEVSTDAVGLVFAAVLILSLIFAALGLALGLTP